MSKKNDKEQIQKRFGGLPQIKREDLVKLGIDSPHAYAKLARKSIPSGHFRATASSATKEYVELLVSMGFTSPEDVMAMVEINLDYKVIEEYQQLGIETAEAIQRAVKRDITPAVAKGYIAQGVFDLDAMVTMKVSGKIGASTLAAYRSLEDFQPEDAKRLKDAGASATSVRACIKVGVKKVDDVIALTHKLKGDDIRLAGLYSVEDAIKLSAIGRNVGDAWATVKMWRQLGIEDVDEILEWRVVWDPTKVMAFAKLLEEKGRKESWKEYAKIILDRRNVELCTLLVEHDATIEQINHIAAMQFSRERHGSREFRAGDLKHVLGVLSVEEVIEIANSNPDVCIPDLWPSSLRGSGFVGTAEAMADRQRLLDAVKYNISYGVLTDFSRHGFTSHEASVLIAAEWKDASGAQLARYGGYSLEEMIAKDETEQDLDLSEAEQEGGVKKISAVPTENWEWND